MQMMHMHSESSETSFILLINRNRLKMCCKLYWRVVVIFLTPLILVPVACISDKNAYKCFYVFLITVVYWLTDVLHPSIVALLPIAASSVMNTFEHGFLSAFYMTTELLDSVAIMMIIIAMEYSRVHRRIAVKLLLIVGCSHYRLSFLLFFTTMFASMWISSVLACGIMMPLVKAILVELEKMGILEMYTSVGKSTQRSTRHELNTPRPTPFTIFYFLGIAYSSSIGGITTIMGSQTNQVFKGYCETIFPDSPKIEFPHFMLLNLPGVLVMETAMYFWLNFYFLGMFRAESDIALEVGLTDEEAQYINTLLASQYAQLGRVKFHEIIVGVLVILACILQSTVSVAYFENQGRVNFHSHYKVSSPCFLSVFLLCIAPVDVKVLKFFKRHNNGNRAMPQYPSKACLNWELVRSNLHWSVLFIVGGSSALFESLKDSHMTEEMEKFLLIFKSWPAPALAIVVIVFCQILTQFAPNSCVAYCLLPSIARLSINSDVNPHYLMVAATLASSMSFHLVTGSPANAMVCAYTHIPPRKMMSAGIGPSLSAIVIVWFTVVVWSTVVWTDINQDPSWADTNILKNF